MMIKVPGTPEGAVAVRRLIADGINVNITLLFSIDAHRRVIDAYLAGLEDRAGGRSPIAGIASVASFFVSRVDTEVDKRLDAQVKAAEWDANHADALRGKAAIANAKLAYRLFREALLRTALGSARREGRASCSARSGRARARRIPRIAMCCMSSSSSDRIRSTRCRRRRSKRFAITGSSPARSMPISNAARRTIAELEAAGISLDRVTDKLLVNGIASFQKSFDSLLAGLARKTQAVAARS